MTLDERLNVVRAYFHHTEGTESRSEREIERERAYYRRLSGDVEEVNFSFTFYPVATLPLPLPLLLLLLSFYYQLSLLSHSVHKYGYTH